MTPSSTIITVASWEMRFRTGLERLLKATNAGRVVMYFYREFGERTASARSAVCELLRVRGCELREHELSFGSPNEGWRTIERTLAAVATDSSDILVDITTMPREAIWAVFFWLEHSRRPISYAYHRPSSYSPGWLARDPDIPRIAFKLSGISKIGKPTALLIVTGYDVDRTTQAIEFFQPAHTVLACQGGEQYASVERNMGAHGYLSRMASVEVVGVDAFNKDHGFSEMKKVVEELAKKNNVMMFSFGPKPTAVALYRIQKTVESSALGFIHCKEYSEEYSKGISETIFGGFDRQ